MLRCCTIALAHCRTGVLVRWWRGPLGWAEGLLDADGDDGDIVDAHTDSGELAEGPHDVFDDAAGGGGGFGDEEGGDGAFDAGAGELTAFEVDGVAEAVGVGDEDIAGLELVAGFFVFLGGVNTGDEAGVAALEDFGELAWARAEDDDGVVSGGGDDELAGGGVDEADEEGDELGFEGVADGGDVDLAEQFTECGGAGGVGAEGAADGGHDECGGDALADDITDGEGELAVEGFDVVEVAAELEAGLVAGGDVEAVELGEAAGEHSPLDIGGELELSLHGLVLLAELAEAVVGEGHGGLIGDGAEEVGLVVGEASGGSAVEAEEAGGAAVVAEAGHEQGADVLAGDALDIDDAGVVEEVGDPDGFTGHGAGAEDAVAGQGHLLAEPELAEAAAGFGLQLAGFIEDGDGSGVEAEGIECEVEGGLQDAVFLIGLDEQGGEAEEGVELAEAAADIDLALAGLGGGVGQDEDGALEGATLGGIIGAPVYGHDDGTDVAAGGAHGRLEEVEPVGHGLADEGEGALGAFVGLEHVPGGLAGLGGDWDDGAAVDIGEPDGHAGEPGDFVAEAGDGAVGQELLDGGLFGRAAGNVRRNGDRAGGGGWAGGLVGGGASQAWEEGRTGEWKGERRVWG